MGIIQIGPTFALLLMTVVDITRGKNTGVYSNYSYIMAHSLAAKCHYNIVHILSKESSDH